MKKFLILLPLFAVGCQPATKTEAVTNREIKGFTIRIKEYCDDFEYHVVEVDGCEYLFRPGGQGGPSITHKGNCKNAKGHV